MNALKLMFAKHSHCIHLSIGLLYFTIFLYLHVTAWQEKQRKTKTTSQQTKQAGDHYV